MNLDGRQQELLSKTFLDYQSTADFLKAPLIVTRAERLYYWDVEGNRYFDGALQIRNIEVSTTLLGN